MKCPKCGKDYPIMDITEKGTWLICGHIINNRGVVEDE